MFRHILVTYNIICIICLICFVAFFTGCENQTEPPQKPRVIRKKIIAKPQEQESQKQKSVVSDLDSKKKNLKTEATEEKETDKKITLIIPAEQTIELPDTTARYNPKGKINPFTPLFKEKPRIINVKRRIPLTPLEKIALSQLKLVGIIRHMDGNKGIVEEASGKGYIIAKGTYIGIHSGSVVDILNDRVIIKETVENILGKLMTRKIELKLQKPPGE